MVLTALLRSKKGIFFTIMAILVVGTVLLFLSTQKPSYLSKRVPAVEKRFVITNDYVKSLKESYLERAVISAGYSALYAIDLYTNRTGLFVLNFTQDFESVFLNGTINKGGKKGEEDQWKNYTTDLQFTTYMAKNTTLDQFFRG